MEVTKKNFEQSVAYFDGDIGDALDYFCYYCNELYNDALGFARHAWIDSNRCVNSHEIVEEMKASGNIHFENLGPDVAQSVCRSVGESIEIFYELTQEFLDGKTECPSFPDRRGSYDTVCYYPASQMRLAGDLIEFPFGAQLAEKFEVDAFHLPIIPGIDFEAIDEVRILPRQGRFILEYSYFVNE